MDLVGITLCVNYSDFLYYTLPANRPYFHDFYVVTVAEDSETRAIAAAHNCKIILSDQLYARGAAFNKSGLVRQAQEVAHADHPTAWICMMDADVLIGENALRLELDHLDPSGVYGIQRLMYETQDDFAKKQATHLPEVQLDPVGYFQLYYDKTKYYPEWSNGCEQCDLTFYRLFSVRRMLDSAICYHLGFRRRNWSGRITERWRIPAAAGASNPREAHTDTSLHRDESR